MSNDNCRERVVSGAHETRVSRLEKGHEKRVIIAASGVVKRAQGACLWGGWWGTPVSIKHPRAATGAPNFAKYGNTSLPLLVDEVHQRPGTARGYRADGHHL